MPRSDSVVLQVGGLHWATSEEAGIVWLFALGSLVAVVLRTPLGPTGSACCSATRCWVGTTVSSPR